MMLIAVEGCIAAGKTTVATGLAALRERPLLLENFEMNPFLREFYQDPEANATETEFAFLLVHYHQLRKQISEGEVIADFHLGKDLIFAEMNMTDQEELRLFVELSAFFTRRVAQPDILVFLSAPSSLICERVRSRARDFEQDIDPSYYEKLSAKYEEFYEHYAGPKLKVPMSEWDFVKSPDLFVRLSSLIDNLSNTSRARNG